MTTQPRLAQSVAGCLTALTVLIFCLWTASPASAATQDGMKREVLLLSSYHAGYKWDDDIRRAVIDVLNPSNNGLELHIEHMDTKRIEDTVYVQMLFELYRYKYRHTPMAVIIASDNFAFNFLRQYRDQLFPGVPVVFCGVNFFQDEMLAGRQQFTGVVESIDAATTVDTILKLHPATRELFVLNDGDLTGQAYAKDISRQITGRHPNLKIRYANPMSKTQAIDHVRTLPADTVVLLGGFLRDTAGEYVSGPEFARELSEASQTPIYGLADLYIGHGIVGGEIITGYHQGKLAALLAQRVLAGESADNIPVIKEGATSPMFDYEQLVRFDIPEKALPKGSVILNKPYSFHDFYQAHKYKIFAVAAFFTVASVLIILLTMTLVARRKAEAQLRDSQQRLALTLDAVNDGVWDWNIQSGDTVFSPRYYTMLDYEPYEFPQSLDGWKDLIHPDDLERVERELALHLERGGLYAIEFRMRKKSGEWRWILARGMLVSRDVAGKPLRMVGAHTDITERKQAEIALKASEERYRLLIELMGEGLVVIDHQTKVTYTNPQFQHMTGFTEQELIGVPLESLLSPRGSAAFQSQFERRKQGASDRYELEWRKKDGGVVSTLISPCPLHDSTGRFIGSFAAISDITEIKRAEQELMTYRDHLEDLVRERTADLEQAKEAAETANRAKSAFLANMSHELRTPLNAILGFSALLRQETAITGQHRKNLDIINTSGEHLLTLINDILDMTKIEAGRIEMQPLPFAPAILAQDIIDLMRARAMEKGLQLHLELSPDLPRFVQGEETKVRQVLVNLVGNALKFTQEGGVVLRLGAETFPSGLRLLLTIEDTGPGIAPEEQTRIFDPFVQLGEAGAQKGTGLGLALTRQFVELMGGSISVTSQLGQGSCFQVELPVAPLTEAEMPPEPTALREISGLEPGQPSYRILVVEDQVENALLLVQLLESAGFQVQTAENGASGIERFREWQPHFIWMDWRMPTMDGLEATRRIRAIKGGDQVKIVALTASVFAEQHREIHAAGVDDILDKPYRPDQLFDCLARQLGVRFTYKSDTPEKKEPLTPAALAALPDALRHDLADALLRLDTAKIDTIIARIAEQDPDLGEILHQQAESFEYELIERTLSQAGS